MEATTTLTQASGTRPSEAQIYQTRLDIEKRLKDPLVQKPVNRAVKEGYTECLNILAEKRETYNGIDTLRIQQGRAIAVLCVDYILGDVTKQVLCGVPFKQ